MSMILRRCSSLRCSFHVHWDSKRLRFHYCSRSIAEIARGLKRRYRGNSVKAAARPVVSFHLALASSARLFPLRRASSISGLVSRPHRPPPFPLDVSVAPLSPSVESRGLRESHFRPSSSLHRRRRDHAPSCLLTRSSREISLSLSLSPLLSLSLSLSMVWSIDGWILVRSSDDSNWHTS